jgi:hypothetical protein
MDTGREFVAGRNSLQQSSQCHPFRRVQPEAYRVVRGSRHLAHGTQHIFAGIAQDTTLTQALYFLGYGLGGPGYSVPLGLLMAGISVPLLTRVAAMPSSRPATRQRVNCAIRRARVQNRAFRSKLNTDGAPNDIGMGDDSRFLLKEEMHALR